MDELEAAFEDASDAVRYYLDLETGLIVAITDDIREELEAIYKELDDEQDLEDDQFAAVLQQRNLPAWMYEALVEADQVEQGFGKRYIAVPTADSREGYRDMQDFIATIGNPRLQSQLAYAIQGRGASTASRIRSLLTRTSVSAGLLSARRKCESECWPGWQTRGFRLCESRRG